MPITSAGFYTADIDFTETTLDLNNIAQATNATVTNVATYVGTTGALTYVNVGNGIGYTNVGDGIGYTNTITNTIPINLDLNNLQQQIYGYNVLDNTPAPAPVAMSEIRYPFDHPIIIVEPPRTRSVLLRRVNAKGVLEVRPTRLALPYIIFVQEDIEAPKNVSNLMGRQFVFVTPEMPTLNSKLHQFPLSFHDAGIAVHNLSHINCCGGVCYGGVNSKVDLKEAFWNTVFNKYDEAYVAWWALATKEGDKQGREYSIRERCPLVPDLGYFLPLAKPFELKLGHNDVPGYRLTA